VRGDVQAKRQVDRHRWQAVSLAMNFILTR